MSDQNVLIATHNQHVSISFSPRLTYHINILKKYWSVFLKEKSIGRLFFTIVLGNNLN